ncbi:hypothetical protein QE357_004952 [Siphonobacter sp. BAB-5404]|nr:hypothetical protein [Siphonobacter sp. SORGH_AS_0500]
MVFNEKVFDDLLSKTDNVSITLFEYEKNTCFLRINDLFFNRPEGLYSGYF